MPRVHVHAKVHHQAFGLLVFCLDSYYRIAWHWNAMFLRLHDVTSKFMTVVSRVTAEFHAYHAICPAMDDVRVHVPKLLAWASLATTLLNLFCRLLFDTAAHAAAHIHVTVHWTSITWYPFIKGFFWFEVAVTCSCAALKWHTSTSNFALICELFLINKAIGSRRGAWPLRCDTSGRFRVVPRVQWNPSFMQLAESPARL